MKSFCILIFLSGLFLSSEVKGHGRLLEPPSRSSLWRTGEFDHLNPPKNYNDNGLNCGGFSHQHGSQGGKCGECGDPYDFFPRPRPNEGGGLYGRGIIVRNYTVGQMIDIFVELTANHRGFFEFRLCPHNNPYIPASQPCLDQNLLEFGNGYSGTRFMVGPGSIFKFQVKLPRYVQCSQCVLQWHYSAGNNWGNCGNQTSLVGCGPQETFRGCADIAII